MILVVDHYDSFTYNLVQLIESLGRSTTVVKSDERSAEDLVRLKPDAVVLSPGPGHPRDAGCFTALLEQLPATTPVLGVCLGHQLLALATGRETFKLPFGHRGANHPVVERATRRVLVTSQNHGFAVAPGGGDGVSHTSLYDGTVEGLHYPDLRARSAQFHPEASPGPHDGAPIIAEWVEELRAVA
jgi:carbamoyl-phosphate synthase small subunit